MRERNDRNSAAEGQGRQQPKDQSLNAEITVYMNIFYDFTQNSSNLVLSLRGTPNQNLWCAVPEKHEAQVQILQPKNQSHRAEVLDPLAKKVHVLDHPLHLSSDEDILASPPDTPGSICPPLLPSVLL
ncbi:hypothetical protein Q8A67_017269 [Cirrhinus molitorella]|uniref:Uncharacterized protein n=1 Tax=Cirrhinus molitorella TaxID=172907 RepID=A0AA88PAR9_9TELE|nr:hypothetical protein Q8A67_017269 [Cirrhinus molitorella]